MYEMKKLRLLLIDESENDAQLLLHYLETGGYDVECERVDTMPAMKVALACREWDLVISDYEMPDFSALSALDTLKKCEIDLPFIVVSGKIGEEKLADAMRSGARDYLLKGNLSRLIPAVDRELREAEVRRTRHRADLAIRQGKMEWEAAFDAVFDIIVLTDPKGTIIRCNRKLIECYRTTYIGVLGRDITELFYGDKGCVGSIFRLCLELKPDHADVQFPMLPGWFSVACFPMHPTESRHGFVYIIKNVTKRRGLEEEKKITDRELLTLYAVASRLNSRRGFKRIMVDLLSQLNQMLQIDISCIHLREREVLLLSAELGLSREFTRVFRNLCKDVVRFKEVLGGKAITSSEYAGHLNGEVGTSAEAVGMGAWCAVPLKIGSGVIGVLFVAHRSMRNYTEREIHLLSSITNQMAILIENRTLYERMKEKTEELQRHKQDLKEHLEEVNRANIELERLNAAKNLFVGMASHELKTPLTSIKGGLQFLIHYSGLSTTPEQKGLMEAVYEGVIQLKGIVDELLCISRIEAKGFVLKKRLVNFPAICEEVRHALLIPLSKRDIEVTIDADSCFIEADEGFCQLVIRNLLENAMKFTPDGGRIAIAGSLVTRNEILTNGELRHFYPEFPANIDVFDVFYRFDIADTGVGIPEDERVRIFEKFYGVGDIANHSSGCGYLSKGAGLGLSIVKGILDAHGGMVWVEPGYDGIGSVFSLLIPLDSTSMISRCE